jgi:hypothetical protein
MTIIEGVNISLLFSPQKIKKELVCSMQNMTQKSGFNLG